jgi:hypothetical protein
MSIFVRRPRLNAVLAGTASVGLALTLTACGGGDDSDTASTDASAQAIDCAPYASFGDLKGKTVSVYTGIVTPEDKPQIDSYKPFEQCTGVTVKYEGDKAFETQVLVRAKAGNPPDIAFVPQPAEAAGRHRQSRRGAAADVRQHGQVLRRGLEGLRHRRRQVLRSPARRQRQVPRVVLAEGVLGRRIQGADHAG